MRCLVFGATGNIGSRVTRLLISRGKRPALFVRDVEKAEAMFGRQVDVHVGNLEIGGEALETALEGIDSVFLVTDGPDLEVKDRLVARASKAAGVRHLLKLSTMDVRSGIGTCPWHPRGEAAVRESGIPCTFLQPAGFMLNALSWATSIRSRGVLRSATGEGQIAFVHEDDIAETAEALLTGARPGQSVVITGPEALSYRSMAATIGATVGRQIRYQTISDHQAHAGVVQWAGEGPYADALIDIWRGVREGRLDTVTRGVQDVLHRAPRSFAKWAEENGAAFTAP